MRGKDGQISLLFTPTRALYKRLTPFSPSSHTDQGVCVRKRWTITFRSDLSSLRLTPFTPSSNTDQGIREENMDHTNNFLLRQELFTFNTVSPASDTDQCNRERRREVNRETISDIFGSSYWSSIRFTPHVVPPLLLVVFHSAQCCNVITAALGHIKSSNTAPQRKQLNQAQTMQLTHCYSLTHIGSERI